MSLQKDSTKLDHWAENLLHGKAYDRWFDKSFNMIISKNGTYYHDTIPFPSSDPALQSLTYSFCSTLWS